MGKHLPGIPLPILQLFFSKKVFYSGIEYLWLQMQDRSTFPIEELFEAGCEYLDRVMSDTSNTHICFSFLSPL